MPTPPPIPGAILTPDALAAALDVLHQAALAIAIPQPQRPDLETAEKPDLRAYILNLEAERERASQRAARTGQELVPLRERVRTMEGALHNIISSSNDGASITAAAKALGLSTERPKGGK